MLKVLTIDKTATCKILIQCMVAGKVKYPGDLIELKLSIANTLGSSGRVSIIREMSSPSEKQEPKLKLAKSKLKVSKREHRKHNK